MGEVPAPTGQATSTDGFYVEPTCCLLCGVPEDIAPEIFHTGTQHCSVIRQPCSADEVDRTIRAMWSSEVDCVRYRGRDPNMLERLARAGLAGQADHRTLPELAVQLRNRVTFDIADGASQIDAREIARLFRADLGASGKKVLPAWLGKRSVWLSWYRNRFHLVRFVDKGQGRLVAMLRSRTAIQGLAWLVDDWLRAQPVENICWQADKDPKSASRTPM